MQVRNSLPGVRSIIGDDTVAAGEESIRGCHLRGQCQRVRGDGPVIGSDVAKGGEVPPGNDKYVDRRLRVQIVEGDVMLTLGNKLCAKLAPYDSAEDAICRRPTRSSLSDTPNHFETSPWYDPASFIRSGASVDSSCEYARTP